MAEIGGSFYGGEVEQIVVKAILDDRGIKIGSEKVIKTVERMGIGVERRMTRSAQSGRILTETIQKQKMQFQMWALTFMFVGLQIQRTAQTMAQTTVREFLAMERAQTEAGASLTAVGAEFAYLRFEIGRALGTALIPLLPAIINIVRGFADIIQKNPEAVFWGIATAIGVGAAVNLASQLVMIASALKDMSSAGVLKGLDSLSGTLATIARIAAGGILIGIGLGEIFEGVTEDDFSKLFGGALATISGGLLVAGKTKGGVVALIAYVAFKVLADEEFREKFISILAEISRLLFAFAAGIGSVFANIFSSLAQGFASVAQSIFKALEYFRAGDYLRAAAEAGKAISGYSFNEGAGVASYNSFKTGFQDAYQAFDMEGSKSMLRGVINPIADELGSFTQVDTQNNIQTVNIYAVYGKALESMSLAELLQHIDRQT